MCNFLELDKKGNCSLLNNQCPYVYFCSQTNVWRPNKYFPTSCKVVEKVERPKGYYKVCFEKKGKLYINVDNYIRIIPNPFSEVPKYVKVYKQKNGEWKIRK